MLKITPILHSRKRTASDTQRITLPEYRADRHSSRVPLIGAASRLKA